MTDVTVTQADRNAAANGVLRRLAYQCGGMQSWMEPAVASMRRGEQDDHPDIQDFARHRIAALADAQEEAVAWMERHDYGDGEVEIHWHVADSQIGRHIAKYQKDQHGKTLFPLYTHPPAQDVEALVSALEWIERGDGIGGPDAELKCAAIARTALANFRSKP